MAYFAQLDDSGIVQQIISISNADAPDPAPTHSEPIGQAFIADVLGLPGQWRQTSFNHSWRKQFAGIGYRYDADGDVFVRPAPFPSWHLDDSYDWQPPTPYPTDGKTYDWNEPSQTWVEVAA